MASPENALSCNEKYCQVVEKCCNLTIEEDNTLRNRLFCFLFFITNTLHNF